MLALVPFLFRGRGNTKHHHHTQVTFKSGSDRAHAQRVLSTRNSPGFGDEDFNIAQREWGKSSSISYLVTRSPAMSTSVPTKWTDWFSNATLS